MDSKTLSLVIALMTEEVRNQLNISAELRALPMSNEVVVAGSAAIAKADALLSMVTLLQKLETE